MDFNTFKENCRKKVVSMTQRDYTFSRLLEEQKGFNKKCYAPKTKYRFNWKIWLVFWNKVCPFCKNNLSTEIVGTFGNFVGDWNTKTESHVIYSCDCGYEYAEIVDTNTLPL